jgi:DNA-binding MarR family transcriptional regulator
MIERMATTHPDQHAAPSAAVPPSNGRGEFIDLLLDTAYYVKLMGETALSETPLSLLSSRMLATVLNEPGITVAEMSRQIPKTQQMISHVAAQLTKLGLLERRLGSGRGVELYATDAGRQVAEEGLTREYEMRVNLRALLTDARYGALEQLLSETRAILHEAR